MYGVMNSNCEHMANQMRYGRPRSKQAEKLQAVVDGATAVYELGKAAVKYNDRQEDSSPS